MRSGATLTHGRSRGNGGAGIVHGRAHGAGTVVHRAQRAGVLASAHVANDKGGRAVTDFFNRLEGVRARWNVLEHSFYQRWSAGS